MTAECEEIETRGVRTLERFGHIAINCMLYVAEFGPSRAYDIAGHIGDDPNNGAVYKSLAMLVKAERMAYDLVDRVPGDHGNRPRKLYDLTPFGWYTVGFYVGRDEQYSTRINLFRDKARQRLSTYID